MAKTKLPSKEQVQRQLQDAANALHDLQRHDGETRDEHAAALKRHSVVAAAPPPIDDVVANWHRLVDDVAAMYAKDKRRGFVLHCGGNLEYQSDGTYCELAARLPDLFSMASLTQRDMIGLFPELLKARGEAIIRSETYASPGPLAERPARVAEIDREIVEIEERHTALVDLARSLDPPVLIELLPAVRERREAAAVKAQREADALEARREAERRVNAHHTARAAQSGRSAYLTQGTSDNYQKGQ